MRHMIRKTISAWEESDPQGFRRFWEAYWRVAMCIYGTLGMWACLHPVGPRKVWDGLEEVIDG